MSGEDIEIHRAGEWSGLYLDGTPQVHGDHYHADEWLYEHFGVKVVDDSPWLIDGRTPLGTLAEVREAARQERFALAHVAELRKQAAELIERANRLDPNGKVPA